MKYNETMQDRPWSIERKKCQPRILYPAKIIFQNENKAQTLSDT